MSVRCINLLLSTFLSSCLIPLYFRTTLSPRENSASVFCVRKTLAPAERCSSYGLSKIQSLGCVITGVSSRNPESHPLILLWFFWREEVNWGSPRVCSFFLLQLLSIHRPIHSELARAFAYYITSKPWEICLGCEMIFLLNVFNDWLEMLCLMRWYYRVTYDSFFEACSHHMVPAFPKRGEPWFLWWRKVWGAVGIYWAFGYIGRKLKVMLVRWVAKFPQCFLVTCHIWLCNTALWHMQFEFLNPSIVQKKCSDLWEGGGDGVGCWVCLQRPEITDWCLRPLSPRGGWCLRSRFSCSEGSEK